MRRLPPVVALQRQPRAPAPAAGRPQALVLLLVAQRLRRVVLLRPPLRPRARALRAPQLRPLRLRVLRAPPRTSGR